MPPSILTSNSFPVVRVSSERFDRLARKGILSETIHSWRTVERARSTNITKSSGGPPTREKELITNNKFPYLIVVKKKISSAGWEEEFCHLVLIGKATYQETVFSRKEPVKFDYITRTEMQTVATLSSEFKMREDKLIGLACKDIAPILIRQLSTPAP